MAYEEVITVAVIDTGIDVNHSLLKGRVKEKVALYDDEPSFHGTAVGSVIVRGNTNIQLIDLDVGTGNMINEDAVQEALEWCIWANIDVVNLSFKWNDVLSLRKIEGIWSSQLAMLKAKGVKVYAASGNSSRYGMVYPASDINVIACSHDGMNFHEEIRNVRETKFVSALYSENPYDIQIKSGSSFACAYAINVDYGIEREFLQPIKVKWKRKGFVAKIDTEGWYEVGSFHIHIKGVKYKDKWIRWNKGIVRLRRTKYVD